MTECPQCEKIVRAAKCACGWSPKKEKAANLCASGDCRRIAVLRLPDGAWFCRECYEGMRADRNASSKEG